MAEWANGDKKGKGPSNYKKEGIRCQATKSKAVRIATKISS
jgi:hypothetical protein